jgi:hypothetical protein
MMSRQALYPSEAVPIARQDSWSVGIVAAFGSRKPLHQRLSSDSVVGNNYLMKAHQPLSSGIETYFYRDWLALL